VEKEKAHAWKSPTARKKKKVLTKRKEKISTLPSVSLSVANTFYLFINLYDVFGQAKSPSNHAHV
jgi:hypothetical protein